MSELSNGIINILNFRSAREMRVHPRLQVMMDAELYGREDFYTPVPAFITDISLGGTSLYTNKRIFTENEEVDCHFTFSPGDKLVLLAKIVRVSGSMSKVTYGCKYMYMTDDNMNKLIKFVHNLVDYNR